MRYTRLIADAWEVATNAKKLKWFAFVPSFIGVLVFMLEIAWQYFFLSEEFGVVQSGFMFEKIRGFFSLLLDNNLIGWGIFFLIFVLIFTFLFPAWIQSTMIVGVHQKCYNPQARLSLRQKIIEGFQYFVSIFEYRAALSPFQFTTILFFSLTLYRYYHGTLFDLFFPIIIGYSIFALFVELFFSFTPYYIVCENEEFAPSIKKSISLVFLNFGATVGLTLVMMLINIRVVINVLVIIGVPAALVFIATYFSGSIWSSVLILGAAIIGLGLVVVAAYITAILEIFSTAIWQRAFTELREKQKKLAV